MKHFYIMTTVQPNKPLFQRSETMPKKILSLALALALALSVFIFPSSADDPISVYLDGVQLTFDVPPQLMNDRTMVPLRAVFEAMGAHVD